MAKVKLELGAELDMLTKGELDQSLSGAGSWQREAAYGMRHIDLPKMEGATSVGAITLGAGQTDGVYCGPQSGFYWRIERISINGLLDATSIVKIYKGDPAGGRFVCVITDSPAVYHPGGAALVLKPGDFLSVTGTGLTDTTITMTGEATSVPGPMMWKLL